MEAYNARRPPGASNFSSKGSVLDSCSSSPLTSMRIAWNVLWRIDIAALKSGFSNDGGQRCRTRDGSGCVDGAATALAFGSRRIRG